MCYPKARYCDERGEISATFRPLNEEPDVEIAAATRMQYLATGESTQQRFGLYHVEMQPGARGADMHFHRTLSEAFYILSGTLRVSDGGQWMDAEVGDCLFVPEGGLHAFHNNSDEPVSFLMLFVPGAPREEYFETLAEAAAGKAFTEQEWREFCIRHDSYFVVQYK